MSKLEPNNDKDTLTFEAALAELDVVLDTLNKGDISLEEALGAYKHGMDMALLCQKKLQEAEGELKVLQKGFEKAFSIEEIEL